MSLSKAGACPDGLEQPGPMVPVRQVPAPRVVSFERGPKEVAVLSPLSCPP